MVAVDIRSGTSLEIGSTKKLFPALFLGAFTSVILDYAVTADGQKFLIPAESNRVSQPITTVLNWSSLLKK